MDKICETEYTAIDFQHRLNLIQQSLKKADLDAVLVINGPDGLDNKESAKMVNWLFKGNNGSIIYADYYLDKLFEESFMVIGQKDFSLFGSGELFKVYFKELTGIKHRDFVIYEDKEVEESKDEFEMWKIKEFYRIVEKHKNIGMFVDEVDSKTFKRKIEEIPLIQSYSLDGNLKRHRWKLFYLKKEHKTHYTRN